MSVATYNGSLKVLGVELVSAWFPRLTVRPEVEASGPSGMLSSKPRTVAVNSITGDFAMTLYPSTELVGTDGRPGVRYILELALFDSSWDGANLLVRHDVWEFTAIAGGGDISTMGSAPPVALIVGPPWPETPRPGTYFDAGTGDLGSYGIGVI